MKGKKTDANTVYQVMAEFAIRGNVREVSRCLNLPPSTVSRIVKNNKNREEFAQLATQKKEEFAKKATLIVDEAMQLLHSRIRIALDETDSMERLIDLALSTGYEGDIKAAVRHIGQMRVQRLGEITTAIGTLYDKRALAMGESTGNNRIEIEFGDGEVLHE